VKGCSAPWDTSKELIMARKHWIWITIAIAVIHIIVNLILTQISGDIIFWRFDGNPYKSPLDRLWLGLYFLLNFPYFILSYFAGPLRSFQEAYYLIWVGNSLVWGLLGAWAVSILPFMKGKKEGSSEIKEKEQPVN
jgi:hypothetical protein